MKYIYFFLCAICFSVSSRGQVINFTDLNLKNALVNTNCVDLFDVNGAGTGDVDADTNDDGEIDVAEALAINGLVLMNSNISSIDDLNVFTNLKYMLLDQNNITTFNVSSMSSLEGLYVNNNQITTINSSQFPDSIITFSCRYNNITTIDLSNMPNLDTVFCADNPLVTLNVSNSTEISEIFSVNTLLTDLDLSSQSYATCDVSNNPNLESINLKNGYIEYLGNHDVYEPGNPSPVEIIKYIKDIRLNNCPSLKFICLDSELEIEYLINANLYSSAFYETPFQDIILSTYCSFTPGGEYFEIQGETRIDANNNGCDASDTIYPNLKINTTNGSVSGSTVASSSGNYFLPVGAGTHTLTPELENPAYFNISPTSFTVDFPTDVSPYNQDFCITPNGTKNDLEIIIIPLEQARPGFDTDYELLIKNKGNTTLSGNFNLVYNDDVMDLVSANPTADTQATGNLIWNYTNLQPFQTQSVLFTMNINTPTDATNPVNGDDILNYTATVNPVPGDELPDDNVFDFPQTVVNSYDPNDKTCLEGKTITPDQVGDYVHYTIRFENTGTASAVNVVVKDEIDVAKYDMSTLVPLKGSHDFVTRVRDTNTVEFIFENINLPEDDANNDGYVVFKIKTQLTLVVGDTFSNKAEIYFDFNAPIITNNETTTVTSLLGVDEFNSLNAISVYPNPVKSELYIKAKNTINNIEVFDVKGSVLWSNPKVLSKETSIAVQDLNSGIYFVKVVSNNKVQAIKFVKL